MMVSLNYGYYLVNLLCDAQINPEETIVSHDRSRRERHARIELCSIRLPDVAVTLPGWRSPRSGFALLAMTDQVEFLLGSC
jgi:hypothetical protein